MTSFIRTAQQGEHLSYIEQILGRTDHFIPLKFLPRRAHKGDFIYLAYRGEIVGRARITEIRAVNHDVPFGSTQRPYPAMSEVWYGKEGWECPGRIIPFKGYQGIRYLDTMGLEGLDSEVW